MGHHSCCNQQKVKRGLWSPEEDEKLIRYITTHGYGCWSEVPEKAGLQRCGKSCRLRWINYLRPDIRRGRFTPEEEKLIISLHGVVGNRSYQPRRYSTWEKFGRQFCLLKSTCPLWAHIASHLPGRTDNEIKNYWNSWIKKKIRKPSSVPSSATAQSFDHHHPQFNYNSISTQLDHFVNQDNLTAKPPVQETLFSSTCPLFMFDTSSLAIGTTTATADTNVRAELFQDTWNLSHQQIHALPPHHQAVTNFTAASVMDTTNYNLPPLIENVENMVPIEVQSCSMDEEGEITLECLQRQELNEWVDTQQQCPSFLFWDNVEGQLGGEVLEPTSSNMGTNTVLSPFPSTL